MVVLLIHFTDEETEAQTSQVFFFVASVKGVVRMYLEGMVLEPSNAMADLVGPD